MRKKYDDPPGFKTCRVCEILHEATNEFYSKQSLAKDLLNTICKKCDNKQRTLRFKNKVSHHIHRRCKACNAFFYAEKCKVKKGLYKYCSRSCASTVKGRIKWNGKRKGELNPCARLSEKDVIDIKTALYNNTPYREVCEKYNISQGHANNIKFNRAWKHITVKGLNHER